jgi:hypothetical protein
LSAQDRGANRTAGRTNWSVLSVARFLLAFVVLNHHLGYFEPNGFTKIVAMFGGKAAVIGFLVISAFS